MVILIEEALIVIEEEEIPILEVDFMVIVLDVAKKGIYILNVDPWKVGRIIEMSLFKKTLRVHQVDLRLEKI